jgi:hypothetical protein
MLSCCLKSSQDAIVLAALKAVQDAEKTTLPTKTKYRDLFPSHRTSWRNWSLCKMEIHLQLCSLSMDQPPPARFDPSRKITGCDVSMWRAETGEHLLWWNSEVTQCFCDNPWKILARYLRRDGPYKCWHQEICIPQPMLWSVICIPVWAGKGCSQLIKRCTPPGWPSEITGCLWILKHLANSKTWPNVVIKWEISLSHNFCQPCLQNTIHKSSCIIQPNSTPGTVTTRHHSEVSILLQLPDYSLEILKCLLDSKPETAEVFHTQ